MYRDDEDPWMEQEAAELASVDADLEMAELAAAGDAVSRARKAGRCPHQGAAGYSGGPRSAQQEGLKIGQLRCIDDGQMGCGQIFESDEDWYAAMDEAMYG